eukprot:m.226692 g.226692  ORF g.226692 m.226692 type:complete len:206 (-) comp26403_c1_seq11:20-637(-)
MDVTPVKDQGNCGSCYAFSATGALEGLHARKTGKLVSFSEQNIVDCSGDQGNQGCNGGLPDNAFRYAQSAGGLDLESTYPYTSVQGKCVFQPREAVGAPSSFVDVASKSETELQQAVGVVGPVSVGIDASHRSFQFYKSGLYNEPACSETDLDHAVLVVGYGDVEGQAAWLVKNSWGAAWGIGGYFWLPMGNNACGIATQASYPM